jgi:hypothetical protein
MNKQTQKQVHLADLLPAFRIELYELLAEQGEPESATRVLGFGNSGPMPMWGRILRHILQDGFGPGHRNVALTPEQGMLILDVADGEIACVEVLDHADVREKLDVVFP